MVSGNGGESPKSLKQLTHSTPEERGNQFIGRVILLLVVHPILLWTSGSYIVLIYNEGSLSSSVDQV